MEVGIVEECTPPNYLQVVLLKKGLDLAIRSTYIPNYSGIKELCSALYDAGYGIIDISKSPKALPIDITSKKFSIYRRQELVKAYKEEFIGFIVLTREGVETLLNFLKTTTGESWKPNYSELSKWDFPACIMYNLLPVEEY